MPSYTLISFKIYITVICGALYGRGFPNWKHIHVCTWWMNNVYACQYRWPVCIGWPCLWCKDFFIFAASPFTAPNRLLKNPMKTTRPFGAHVPTKITREETQSGRKPCQLCKIKGEKTPNGGGVMTRYRCSECHVPLCSGDIRHCFFEYHRDMMHTLSSAGPGAPLPTSYSLSDHPELSHIRNQINRLWIKLILWKLLFLRLWNYVFNVFNCLVLLLMVKRNQLLLPLMRIDLWQFYLSSKLFMIRNFFFA